MAAMTSDQAIRWVGWAMALRVDRRDAPNQEAWNLLQWTRRRPTNTDTFWSIIFARVLPMTDSGTDEAEELVVSDEERTEHMALIKQAAETAVRQAEENDQQIWGRMLQRKVREQTRVHS